MLHFQLFEAGVQTQSKSCKNQALTWGSIEIMHIEHIYCFIGLLSMRMTDQENCISITHVNFVRSPKKLHIAALRVLARPRITPCQTSQERPKRSGQENLVIRGSDRYEMRLVSFGIGTCIILGGLGVTCVRARQSLVLESIGCGQWLADKAPLRVRSEFAGARFCRGVCKTTRVFR